MHFFHKNSIKEKELFDGIINMTYIPHWTIQDIGEMVIWVKEMYPTHIVTHTAFIKKGVFINAIVVYNEYEMSNGHIIGENLKQGGIFM